MCRTYRILPALFALVACGPAKIPGSGAAGSGANINLSYAAMIDGNKKAMDSGPVTVVRPGKITFENQLMARDGSPLSDGTFKTESKLLRIYVTDYEPTSPREILNKKVWWWQKWDKNTTFDLSTSVANQKVRLFVTLVKVDPLTNRDTIVQSVPIDLFVDGKSTGVNWVSPSQFVPAAKDAVISLQVELVSQGAALDGNPVVESSIDGSTWSAIPIDNWAPVANQKNNFTFSIKYPFAEEKPFRIRVKAKDTIGNANTSDPSPNLIGRVGFAYAAPTENERASCKDAGGNAASRLWLGSVSSVLCRGRDSDGQVTSTRKLPVIVDNRGAVAYKVAAGVSGLSSYMNYVQTSGVYDIRAVNLTDAFLLSDELLKTPRVIYWQIDNARMASTVKLGLALDRTLSGKYASSDSAAQGNTCYPAGDPVPQVILADTAAGVVLQDSNFACDE